MKHFLAFLALLFLFSCGSEEKEKQDAHDLYGIVSYRILEVKVQSQKKTQLIAEISRPVSEDTLRMIGENLRIHYDMPNRFFVSYYLEEDTERRGYYGQTIFKPEGDEINLFSKPQN